MREITQVTQEVLPFVKKKKPRRVYGRRRLKKDGTVFNIELRKDKLVIRELYSRREQSKTLGELVDIMVGQNIFQFERK